MSSNAKQGWAMGGTVFAATVMIVLGFFQVMMGISALAHDRIFVTVNNYVYGIDTTSWGWIHLILGAVIVITGCFLFMRTMWARALGIVLAVVSAVGNFMFMPYYPLWSMVVIALNIFVIWSLATVVQGVDTPAATAAGSGSGGGMPRGEAPSGGYGNVNPPMAPHAEDDKTMYPGAEPHETGRPAQGPPVHG
ncbi:MAG TPA: hypothetical protein VE172_07450 [Stackebrandtia sp.]|jgi:hypothetical protein|uniref:DUF7144 family membrane protein n=1 Tax=Stackebrandtia sp. TaxID=2023065 RepID=UPI002D498607|nr:hypothetical protein [Stackebrandtia sp.]HZE38634.1 hypothetical protein [Stackebrandtia sp.]